MFDVCTNPPPIHFRLSCAKSPHLLFCHFQEYHNSAVKSVTTSCSDISRKIEAGLLIHDDYSYVPATYDLGSLAFSGPFHHLTVFISSFQQGKYLLDGSSLDLAWTADETPPSSPSVGDVEKPRHSEFNVRLD
jgi:hypothetical protein